MNNHPCRQNCPLNLDSAIEREKEVQDIGVHRKLEDFVVTLLVMKVFSSLLGASRAFAYFRDSTAEFRLNAWLDSHSN